MFSLKRSAATAARAQLMWAVDRAWSSNARTYWYWGSLAMFQVGGKYWRAWNKEMKGAIVKNQHPKGSGARTGSWDPIGIWGRAYGGRVFSTALMTMSLEVYYRYDRVFGVK